MSWRHGRPAADGLIHGLCNYLQNPTRMSYIFKLLLLLLYFQSCRPSADANPVVLNNELVILAMAPFLDPDRVPSLLGRGWCARDYVPSWYGGAAMIPAARLAVKHINNHSGILPGFTLRLLEGNSGCNLEDVTLVNFTALVFNHSLSQKIVGMVGPGCSESALVLAPIISHPKLNIMQVSIATTPDINNTSKNSFRTVGSTLVEVDAFCEMIEQFKWKRVGALYENERRFHSSTFNAFAKKLESNDTLGFSYALVKSNMVGFVDALRGVNIRVFFVFAAADFSRGVLCLAFLNNLTYPRVQFLFLERVREDFTSSNVSINGSTCSIQDMEEAMNGVILVNKRNSTDSDDTIAGVSYADYLSLYEKEYNDYLSEFNIDRSNEVSVSAVNFFSGYYDAVWALALAVNKTASRFDLSEYRLSQAKEINDDIRSNLENIHFEGMSGLITFDKQRRDVPTIGVVISQVTKEQNVTGYFTKGADNLTSDNFSFDGEFIEYKYRTEIDKIHVALGIAMVFVALLLAVLLFVLQMVFCKYSDVKEVKATSPVLNHLIFSGCYLLILIVIVNTLRETFVPELARHPVLFGVSCSVIFWGFALAFTLIFGTVSSKTWRIYRIFSHFKQGRVRFVSDEHLALFISGLILVDVILLISWDLTDPWRMSSDLERKNDTTFSKHYECKCDNLVSWLAALFVYKGVLTGLAVYLSILVRRVKRKAFKSTKKVIVLIYALILIFFVGFTVYGVFFHIPIVRFLAYSLTFLISVVMITISLFISNIWPILVGDSSSDITTDSTMQKRSIKRTVPAINVDTSHISQLSTPLTSPTPKFI